MERHPTVTGATAFGRRGKPSLGIRSSTRRATIGHAGGVYAFGCTEADNLAGGMSHGTIHRTQSSRLLELHGGSAWLEEDYRTLAVRESVTDANSTAGNDTYAGHLPTYTDANATFEMVGTTGSGTAHWTKLAPTTIGTLVWYPEGTASTKPKHTAAAYISSRDRSYPYADVVTVSIGFQFDGAITDAEVA